MKYLNIPIRVDAEKGIPRRVRRQERTYRVRKLLDYWIIQGRWWGREEKRTYYRLDTDRGVIEVYRQAFRNHADVSAAARLRSTSPTPFPMEGDTHTREMRRIDTVYRPDVLSEEPRSRPAWTFQSWMLSRVLD